MEGLVRAKPARGHRPDLTVAGPAKNGTGKLGSSLRARSCVRTLRGSAHLRSAPAACQSVLNLSERSASWAATGGVVRARPDRGANRTCFRILATFAFGLMNLGLGPGTLAFRVPPAARSEDAAGESACCSGQMIPGMAAAGRLPQVRHQSAAARRASERTVWPRSWSGFAPSTRGSCPGLGDRRRSESYNVTGSAGPRESPRGVDGPFSMVPAPGGLCVPGGSLGRSRLLQFRSWQHTVRPVDG